MKIRFLETSEPGLRWMRRYFRQQSQLDRRTATARFARARSLLKQEPFAGHVFDEIEGVFELKIQRTAFSILYAVKDDTVYILDIRDQRGFRSSVALREYVARLRRKYQL